jgi:hypothetical protein
MLSRNKKECKFCGKVFDTRGPSRHEPSCKKSHSRSAASLVLDGELVEDDKKTISLNDLKQGLTLSEIATKRANAVWFQLSTEDKEKCLSLFFDWVSETGDQG